MRAISTLLLLLTLTSIAHAGAPPAAPQTPPTDDQNATLSWDGVTHALSCQDEHKFWSGSCVGVFTLTLRAKKPIRVLRAMLTTDADADYKTSYEYEAVRIGAGQRWQTPLALSIYQAGRWTFTLTYADEAGAEHQLAATMTATNVTRATAQARCAACRGELRAWGMSRQEWCNCGTRDAGEPCDDGRDCEGACLATKDATPRDKPGSCAPRKVTFGCHREVIYDPASPAGRQTVHICAD